MATELSSNWKKLQATLRHVSPSPNNRKRISHITERQNNTLTKRQRLDTNSTRIPIMKASRTCTMKSTLADNSCETVTKLPFNRPSLKPVTLNSWAKENDIPISDIATAYKDKLQIKTDVGQDRINEGLRENVEIGRYVGIDCEMVGVGKHDHSVLARVSIVNFYGIQIYDSFVQPREFVTNWRTSVSGISPKHMKHARDIHEVRKKVASILKDRIIVGHALWNDFKVMQLNHPKVDTRDTSLFSGFRKYNPAGTPSLKILAEKLLGIEIQKHQHSSIEDARAAMFIFRLFKSAIEAENKQQLSVRKVPTSGSKPKPNIPKSKSKHKKPKR